MPLYEFKCKDKECEHIFEEIQKHTDPNPQCEKCEEETEKIISQTSFALKGSCWYKDGYSKPAN
jgi:putative FmdB family regulatory protein